MQLHRNGTTKYVASFSGKLLPIVLAAMTPAAFAGAQTQASATSASSEPYRIYHLKYISSQNEMNDAVTNLRSMLRRSQFYGNYSARTISIRGTPEEIQTAETILAELDRPRPAYRLTYTITDSSAGKPAASRSFALTALAGQKVTFKQGDRVPVVTGKQGNTDAGASTQMTYVDVGISIAATLKASADSLILQSEVQESAAAQESVRAQDPVIHQTFLSSTAKVTPGKPQVLGSIDVPGATRREQIEVKAEAIGGQ